MLPQITRQQQFAPGVSRLEHESPEALQPGSAVLACGSLVMASIEAICTLFVALSKLGILVAFTSFLSALIASQYHANRIRVPVLTIAFGGAALNLLILWNRRRLRKLPSAAWRIKSLSARQRWRIRLLIALSAITMFLIVAEFWIHPLRRF